MQLVSVFLKKGKEAPSQRHHHWIFSGAIQRVEGSPQPGDWCAVFSSSGVALGWGYWNGGSISVKLLDFTPFHSFTETVAARFTEARNLRIAAGLWENPQTNCFRWVHAEGDAFPGVVLDVYHQTLVIQLHHVAYAAHADVLAEQARKILGNRIHQILIKYHFERSEKQELLFGREEEGEVLENGLKFQVNWMTGQKTGFFLDQRENRNLLRHYSRGKNVLNAFSYTGGFSVYALAGGAKQVASVDISAPAIEMANRNAEKNGYTDNHQGIVKDVVPHIRELGAGYDVIVLDPPAFAKSMNARHNALMAYKRINSEALKQLPSNSVLFTFSCSQVVDSFTFRQTVLSAALESGKKVRILHTLAQPADHPVNLFHPESAYLKGLVLFVH